MATYKGSQGTIKIAGNAIAEVVSFNIDFTAEFSEDTNLNDVWKTHIGGGLALKGAEVSLACHYDDTDTTGQDLMIVGSEVTLVLFPALETAGHVSITCTASVTAEGVNVSGNTDTTARTYSLLVNGEPVRATIV